MICHDDPFPSIKHGYLEEVRATGAVVIVRQEQLALRMPADLSPLALWAPADLSFLQISMPPMLIS